MWPTTEVIPFWIISLSLSLFRDFSSLAIGNENYCESYMNWVLGCAAYSLLVGLFHLWVASACVYTNEYSAEDWGKPSADLELFLLYFPPFSSTLPYKLHLSSTNSPPPRDSQALLNHIPVIVLQCGNCTSAQAIVAFLFSFSQESLPCTVCCPVSEKLCSIYFVQVFSCLKWGK